LRRVIHITRDNELDPNDRGAKLWLIFLIAFSVVMVLGITIGVMSAHGAPRAKTAQVQPPHRYSCQPAPDLTPDFISLGTSEFDGPTRKINGVRIHFTLLLGDYRQVGVRAEVVDKYRSRVLELTDTMSFERQRLDNGAWSPFNRCQNGNREFGEAGNHIRLAYVTLTNSRHHFRAVYTVTVVTATGMKTRTFYVRIV